MLTFAIIGASGEIIAPNVWNMEDTSKANLAISAKQHTMVEKTDESAAYIVNNGTTNDFKRIETGSGFELGTMRVLRVGSQVRHIGRIHSRISILEYDKARNRIGEVATKTNTEAIVAVRPETEHVIVAVRLSGEGQVTFEALDIRLTPERPKQPGPYVETLEVASVLKNAPKETLQGLHQEAEVLSQISKRIESSLASMSRASSAGIQHALDSPTLESTVKDQSDEEISASRERQIRRLLESMASTLPDSNGSHHYAKIPASVAIITDEYMYNFYRDVFYEITYLTPENYVEQLQTKHFDALIYVTCWKGTIAEEWKGVKFRERPKQAFADILEHFRNNDRPAIFQSIEDPSNFEYFLPIAKNFDHVFTSDINKIEDYRAALGHDNVYYGEYGANPLVNNPIGSYRFDMPQIFFAGSYPERYPERTADMDKIFASIPDSSESLVIADRNLSIEGFNFPESVKESIIGAFPHAILQKIHKLFRYSLNFNSIKSSPSMCAMRVYELQAQGKAIVSNYARSVFNTFPEIRIVSEITRLNSLTSEYQSHVERALCQRAMHNIMHEKTSYSVVSNMMSKVGLPGVEQRDSRVLVLPSGDPVKIRAMLAKQERVEFELYSVSDSLSTEVDLSNYGYVAWMSDKYDYSSHYLLSRVNAFKYADIEFVTQSARFENGRYIAGAVHEYADDLSNNYLSMVSTASQLARLYFDGDAPRLYGAGYLVDPYEVNFDGFLASEATKTVVPEPRLSVIVPVFNNGRFLRTKCLPSLLRNKAWPLMEVLLVDDSSTDWDTIATLEHLDSIYPNVRVVPSDGEGSGSASRPRNRGIDLARAPLLSFLDPDNEISESGYDILLDSYDSALSGGYEVDFVSGYQVKVASTTSVTGRHASGKPNLVIDARADYFARGKFPVVSTQAAVIRREHLNEVGLRYVEGAAGQDTLFGWELLASASNALFIDTAHLIYYAERDDSVTNVVNISYFEKSLVMEQAQVRRLQALNLYDLYVYHHLENFIKNWYVKRLNLVDKRDREEARYILDEIVRLYNRDLSEFVCDTAILP